MLELAWNENVRDDISVVDAHTSEFLEKVEEEGNAKDDG